MEEKNIVIVKLSDKQIVKLKELYFGESIEDAVMFAIRERLIVYDVKGKPDISTH